MYTFHMIFDFLIFFLANLFILVSTSMFDAINNSLGILILNNLFNMGSKYFLLELSGYFQEIQNDENFLKFEFDRKEY